MGDGKRVVGSRTSWARQGGEGHHVTLDADSSDTEGKSVRQLAKAIRQSNHTSGQDGIMTMRTPRATPAPAPSDAGCPAHGRTPTKRPRRIAAARTTARCARPPSPPAC